VIGIYENNSFIVQERCYIAVEIKLTSLACGLMLSCFGVVTTKQLLPWLQGLPEFAGFFYRKNVSS